jgi:hypothetical protein
MEICSYCDRPTGDHASDCPYRAQSNLIAGRSLHEWRELARRDDCFDLMVPSDLRQILAAVPD